ncbi:SDR family NAD(P)-dependent oxidoreductase [Cohnella yongneupensis]|uniref:SDR family NAD(P)-dependent oxidoreductase n=1 Tax=Cohnella yongneupensis TaxID=425006 RepID=A0ABW0QWR3_9BACL
MNFKGEVVVITGAGSGIGETSAKRFASEGAHVIIADINEEATARVARQIRQAGGEACELRTDVSNMADIRKLIAFAVDTYGKIDVLFNNAAILMPKSLEEGTEEEWDRLCDVNLKGVIFCTKYAMPELRKTKGRIVNMASLSAEIGQKNNPFYPATKGGIIAFTRSLAIDCAMEGIRINAICPAGVSTPLLEEWFNRHENPEELRKSMDLVHMLGRTATADEIANVVLFLAGTASSFITGQVIDVDGGASLGYGFGPKPEWQQSRP